jgi:hypothetical protein
VGNIKSTPVDGGTVGYSLTGKRKVANADDGIFLRYQGPKADKVFVIQFVALEVLVYRAGKAGQRIGGSFRDPRAPLHYIRNGMKYSEEGKDAVLYVDSLGPSGIYTANAGKLRGLGGIHNNESWMFDDPDFTQVVTGAEFAKRANTFREPNEGVKARALFTTFFVEQVAAKKFKAFARANWSSSSWIILPLPGQRPQDAAFANKIYVKGNPVMKGVGQGFGKYQQAYKQYAPPGYELVE